MLRLRTAAAVATTMSFANYPLQTVHWIQLDILPGVGEFGKFEAR
jgi:hypothetical protein